MVALCWHSMQHIGRGVAACPVHTCRDKAEPCESHDCALIRRHARGHAIMKDDSRVLHSITAFGKAPSAPPCKPSVVLPASVPRRVRLALASRRNAQAGAAPGRRSAADLFHAAAAHQALGPGPQPPHAPRHKLESYWATSPRILFVREYAWHVAAEPQPYAHTRQTSVVHPRPRDGEAQGTQKKH